MPSPEACLPLITTAPEWGQIHSSVLDQSTLWCRKVAWAADLSLAYTWDDRRLLCQACTDVQSWSSVKHCCSPRKPASWGLFALESVFWRSQLGKLSSDGPRRLWIIHQSLYISPWLCPQGQSLVTLCPKKHVARWHIYTSLPSRQPAISSALNLHPVCPWTCHLWISLDPSPIFLSPKATLTSLQAVALSTKPRGTVGRHTTFCQTYSSDCSNLPWERPLNFHSILSFSLLPCDYRHSSWN